MYQVIIVIQVLVGLSIIGLVLMQQGKGADAGAAFGSGSSGSVFGSQGSASFLSKVTGILAVVFFASSLSLAVLSGYQGKSQDIMDVPVVDEMAEEIPLSSTDVINKIDESDIVIPDTPEQISTVDTINAEQSEPEIVQQQAETEIVEISEQEVPTAEVSEQINEMVDITEQAGDEIDTAVDAAQSETEKAESAIEQFGAEVQQPAVGEIAN